MAHGILFVMTHFSKRPRLTDGLENWIVTMTGLTAHRPNERAVDEALDNLIMPVWPRQN